MLELINIKKAFNRGTINEKKALNGVNIKLDDGDFVTIIGGNGAGKSTTLNAIAGVWPVDEGSIIINGKNVTGLSEHQRAKYIGRVFQDPMTGTAATMEIQENLALAKRRGEGRFLKWGITRREREEYHALLKMLDLGLEDRMSSKVGLLSGGQRQKMGIARALLSRAEYMIFDEATSSVDPQSEKEIWETIGHLAESRTLIIISHRMSSVQNADCIYVLRDGRVAQHGTHEVLMAEAGLYKELVVRQQAMEVAE